MKKQSKLQKHSSKLELKIKEATNWRKTRVALIVSLIIAIIEQRSVGLKKLAISIESEYSTEARYRRITRFFQHFVFDRVLFAKLLSIFLPKKRWILAMDRTNWKFGKVHINFLVLSVAYKGIAIPLLWYVLKDKKRGNSSYRDRIRIMKKFIDIFGKNKIAILLADREFIGKEWFAWLQKREVAFAIRIRNNTIVKTSKGEKKVNNLFRDIQNGEYCLSTGRYTLYGQDNMRLQALRNERGELIVIATNQERGNVLKVYKRRWEIENMFSALKKRGLNLEDTHLQDYKKLTLLFGLMALSFVWCYYIGVEKAKEKPIKILKHGYKEKSYFLYGLDHIQDVLLHCDRNQKEMRWIFGVFIELLDGLTGCLKWGKIGGGKKK